jgi:hypothetical protein
MPEFGLDIEEGEMPGRPVGSNDVISMNPNEIRDLAGVINDVAYIHTQNLAATVWVVTHNLDKFPSVTVVDSGGNFVETDVVYIDPNTVNVVLSYAISGKAYLN